MREFIMKGNRTRLRCDSLCWGLGIVWRWNTQTVAVQGHFTITQTLGNFYKYTSLLKHSCFDLCIYAIWALYFPYTMYTRLLFFLLRKNRCWQNILLRAPTLFVQCAPLLRATYAMRKTRSFSSELLRDQCEYIHVCLFDAYSSVWFSFPMKYACLRDTRIKACDTWILGNEKSSCSC